MTSVIATAVPWPGSLIAIPLTTRMAASPIGPASQLSLGSPQSEQDRLPHHQRSGADDREGCVGR